MKKIKSKCCGAGIRLDSNGTLIGLWCSNCERRCGEVHKIHPSKEELCECGDEIDEEGENDKNKEYLTKKQKEKSCFITTYPHRLKVIDREHINLTNQFGLIRCRMTITWQCEDCGWSTNRTI